MDLTLFPSGNFDTNYLVCALAAVAMNLLRLIGQRRGCHLGCHGQHALDVVFGLAAECCVPGRNASSRQKPCVPR